MGGVFQMTDQEFEAWLDEEYPELYDRANSKADEQFCTLQTAKRTGARAAWAKAQDEMNYDVWEENSSGMKIKKRVVNCPDCHIRVKTYLKSTEEWKAKADKLAEALEQIIASYEYGDEDFMREPGDPDFIQNMEIIAREALKEYLGEK